MDALSIGTRLSVHPARQLKIRADPKYFFRLSVRYSVIAGSRRSCRLARATNYGLHTETLLFLYESCNQTETCIKAVLTSSVRSRKLPFISMSFLPAQCYA